MKLGKRSRWIIILVVLLVAMTVLITQVDSVQATFTNMHAFTVLLRVETEIMQKTPAGQYYESLFWKHNDELMQIASQHPENNEEFFRVTRLFIPGLEALLNGEGDTVEITFEQVESLEAELDWLANIGSPGLREDIQKEQQRLPLDIFIGMTMNEALDFINSTWAPDSIVEKTLVPDSDGSWAYYVHKNMYLEYPSNYAVQVSGFESDYIYFMPLQGLPEQWYPCVMKVHIWNVPATDMNATSDPRAWFSHENVVWERSVQNTEFPGVEFISSRGSPSRIDLHAFLYNQEKRLAVEVRVLIMESQQFPDGFDYSAMVDNQYEYFQHLVDSFKLDTSSMSEWQVQQTPTMPESIVQPSPTPELVIKTVLAPGSKGKYEVQGGVYVEYLSSYNFQVIEGPIDTSRKYIGFHPTEGYDQQRPYSIMLETWNGSLAEKERLTNNLYSLGGVIWERKIQTEEFEGVEYILSASDGPVVELGTLLYNQESQLIIHMYVMGLSSVPLDANFSELIDQSYPHFQHIVDNLHIQVP